MRDLLTRFLDYIREKNLFSQSDKLLLACSGGIDSVVLTDLCQLAGFNFELAHCNFQLRGEESRRDEEFVRGLAKKYGRKIFVRSFATEEYAASKKCSIQVAARQLRYQWFHDLMKGKSQNGEEQAAPEQSRATRLLTAHHLDDNIETLVMNFFRGTGIEGLHGMLPLQGDLARPLLFAGRAELEEYAKSRSLDWVEDSSNSSLHYRRNEVRHRLLPLVADIFPQSAKSLEDNITRFAEAGILYAEAVEVRKKKLSEKRNSEYYVPVLKLKKSLPLRTLVFEIFREFGLVPAQTEDLIRLLDSQSGKYLLTPSHRILKDRQWLIISRLGQEQPSHILIESDERKAEAGNFSLHLSRLPGSQYLIGSNPLIGEFDARHIVFPLLLRKWRPGDYFYPLHLRKKKKLSRFLIDQKLSLLQKENTWVIESARKIIWVVGLRIDDRFALVPSTQEVLKIEMRVP